MASIPPKGPFELFEGAFSTTHVGKEQKDPAIRSALEAMNQSCREGLKRTHGPSDEREIQIKRFSRPPSLFVEERPSAPILVSDDLSAIQSDHELEILVKYAGDIEAAIKLKDFLRANRCQLGSFLGAGAFGAVCELFKNGRPDGVIKIYNLGKLRNAGSAKFVEERGSSLQLDYRGVVFPETVLLYDREQIVVRGCEGAAHSDSAELLATIMRRIPGRSLAVLLQENALSSRQKVQIAQQLAETLSHLHEHHILHRDVKPQNIVVAIDAEGRCEASLIDVDLAKRVDPEQKTRSPVGSRLYHCPERMFDETTYYGTESDAWAFGVVLYEMAYGKLPYKNIWELSEKDFQVSFPAESDLPEQLTEVVKGLLNTSPHNRMTLKQAHQILSSADARR